MHKNRVTGCRGPPGEESGDACPAAFEDYGEVTKTVPLDFKEDDVPWVASKLSGAVGVLGAEAIDLRNWLLRFGFLSEDLRVIVSRLADWMANFPPPRSTYCALMAFRLMALDKRPGFHPVGIEEMLRRSLARLLTRAAGDQAKTACGNLQLCTGLEASIEGATHAVGHRKLERARVRLREEETRSSDEEEETERVVAVLGNINIEAA